MENMETIYALPCDADGWRVLPNGNRVHLGAHVQIGPGSVIGEKSVIGPESKIGAWTEVGAGSVIGARTKIGAGATDVIDLGHYEGCRKVIGQVRGTAYIGAGCWWFTLAEAREHWAGREDRPITIAMLDVAEAIAKARGWKIG